MLCMCVYKVKYFKLFICRYVTVRIRTRIEAASPFVLSFSTANQCQWHIVFISNVRLFSVIPTAAMTVRVQNLNAFRDAQTQID